MSGTEKREAKLCGYWGEIMLGLVLIVLTISITTCTIIDRKHNHELRLKEYETEHTIQKDKTVI